MIRVTIWNENIEERWDDIKEQYASFPSGLHDYLAKAAPLVKLVHPNGLHQTLAELFGEEEDISVRTATLDMPGCGLSDDVLDETDVLVWWGHLMHDSVPDELASRVRDRVLKGMGFIALHSAHLSKPFKALMGTSCTLKWREGDFSRVWTVAPSHPIAQGVPEYIELDEEEMYGEFFDVPAPDEHVFTSWFSGGEVFRSGLCWTRGYGRVFYFQPGHESNRSYLNPDVRRILKNAVRWAAPTCRRESLDCPNPKAHPFPRKAD